MLNITHSQRNANQNHNEVPLHTSQNVCDPKVCKQWMLERVWRKGNPPTLLVGMQTSTATMENSVEIPLKIANSLLFNRLSRLVIPFLSRSKPLLISWLQSPFAVILEPQNIKSVTVSFVSPSICHEVMWPDAMILVFWMLSFKPRVLSLFQFHQEMADPWKIRMVL